MQMNAYFYMSVGQNSLLCWQKHWKRDK